MGIGSFGLRILTLLHTILPNVAHATYNLLRSLHLFLNIKCLLLDLGFHTLLLPSVLSLSTTRLRFPIGLKSRRNASRYSAPLHDIPFLISTFPFLVCSSSRLISPIRISISRRSAISPGCHLSDIANFDSTGVRFRFLAFELKDCLLFYLTPCVLRGIELLLSK